MRKKISTSNTVIYQAKTGAIELRGDFARETVWATQAQIADAFGADRSVVTKHIRNILKDKELDEKSVCAKFAHTADDGKTYQVQHYNLDVILAVGYRTNSKRAIAFRKWATQTLRDHIVEGYTINRVRIQNNYAEFLKAVESVQHLLPEHVTLDPEAVLELIKEFSSTWVSLDAYDKGSLTPVGATKRSVAINSGQLRAAIEDLRTELIRKGEAQEIFAQERVQGSVEGIVGAVMQSMGGEQLYKTAEEKAAHLLYFMVKNHPFVDGNKRSGAFAFIWFLRKQKIKGGRNINPSALTALTLLIAESDPTKMKDMVALVTQLMR